MSIEDDLKYHNLMSDGWHVVGFRLTYQLAIAIYAVHSFAGTLSLSESALARSHCDLIETHELYEKMS